MFRAGSAILFSFLISGGFFYLNQFFTARLLGVAIYGEFGALFSLSIFLQSILFTLITVMVSNSIAKFKGRNNLQILPFFHSKLLLYMTLAGVIALVIFFLLSAQIAKFLHIDSILLVFFIGIIFFFCWIMPANLGIIQGLQRFNHMVFLNVLPAALRFVFCMGLMMIGFGIYGAVGGLALGLIIALIVSFYLLRDIIRFPGLKSSSPSQSDPDHSYVSAHEINFEIKETFRHSFSVLLAVVCITIPTNIDVVLIKHFFSASDTGLYTAVSVFGRIIFSIPIAIVTVMYPKVVETYTQKRETKDLLKRSLIYTGLPAGFLAIVFYVIPNFFLGLFYGREYIEAGSFLQMYGIFIFFFSLTTVLLYNSLAKNRYRFVYLFTAFSILEIVLIWLYHGSIILILQILLLISVIVCVIGFCMNYSYPLSTLKQNTAQ